MDSCIADNISQRTALLLKSLSHMENLRYNMNNRDGSRCSSFHTPWEYNEPKSEAETLPNTSAHVSGVRSPTKSGSKGERANKSMTTVVSKPSSSKIAKQSNSYSHQSSKKPKASSRIPPTEGVNRPPNRDSALPRNIPRYETYYTPKSYQPVPMFNLSISKPSTSNGESKTNNKPISKTTHSKQTSQKPPAVSKSTKSTTDPPYNFENPYNFNHYMPNSRSYSSLGSSYMNGNLKNTYNPQPFDPNAYPWSLASAEELEEMSSTQEEVKPKPQKGKVCRKATLASKCKSAVTQQDTSKVKGKAHSSGVKARKSMLEGPDHNNNFYKGGQSIFFTNRIRMPGRNDECDLSGQDRINWLAQPKCYCNDKEEQKPNDKQPYTKYGKSQYNDRESNLMERLNYLAQPKLCHYTVCSCCLSPNCLGECTTKMNVNRTNLKNASSVDWNRLATPRVIQPPPSKVLGAVKPQAMKKQLLSKRIERLAIPRKVINSGDYYIWLWNKKPDTRVYIKTIKRLCVSKCDMKDTRVLLRCDLDFTKGKPIDCKIRDTVPTMNMALKKGAKSIIIISRCGPEGIPKDLAYSLKPLAQVLQQYLETPVIFLDDCCGFQAKALCEDPVPGSVFLLENLSFHAEEHGYVVSNGEKTVCKRDDVARFQKIISDHGDIYVTDCFNELVHMTNTTVGYPPKEFAYGFNIKKELSIFNTFALNPPVPVLAILAGAFEQTWTVLRNLMGQVTDIMIGGNLAYVFIKALKGVELGKTNATDKMEKRALKLFSRAKDTNTTLHLPSDVVVKNMNTDEYFVALTREDVDDWFEIVDIGPHTRKCFTDTIKEAVAIIWMGMFGSLSDGTEIIKEAFLEAAKAGTPTYAADDTIKSLISIVSQPENCLFVTGDGEATECLLRGQIPKGLAVLSKSRKKTKREPIPEQRSTKPLKYELPGEMIIGGTKAGVSYGASDSLLCINHIPVEDVKVLIRVEFNEPMKGSQVTNNYRMRMTIPTIKYALKWRARAVVILAHFRDPMGRRESEVSLKPICDEMATLLGETVVFVPKTVGKDVMTTVNQVHPGSVLMVENVRFQPEEEQSFLHLPDGRLRPVNMLQNPSERLPSGFTAEMNAQFCEELSRLGDVFVNDAFGGLHQDHASITGNFRPTRVCGFLVKNELKYLAKLLNYPNRKFLVILGGTHMDDKLDILPGILKEADSLILAGTLACLFLKVEHGLKTGRTHFSPRLQDRAKEMIKLAAYYKTRIHYPVDLAVSTEPEGKTIKQVSISEGIPKGYEFVDIGKLSGPMFTRIIKRNNMIFWHGVTGNGKLDYDKSCTKQLMEALSIVTHDPEKQAVTIVGGRGLSQIVEQYDPDHTSFTHLTTGGRVALQLLAERTVIGLEYLLPKPGKRPMSLISALDYPEIKDAVVLMRCDLDIPLIDGLPFNTFPIQHIIESTRQLIKKGAKVVVLAGHRGEPDGAVVEELSLEPMRNILESMFEQTVIWLPAGVNPEANNLIQNAPKGSICLLENLCFHPEEIGIMKTEAGTRVPISHDDMAEFRTKFASMFDVYVNESFGTLHRCYTSVVGIETRPCIAGPYLKKQIYDYVDIRRQMESPFLLIMGTEEVDDIFQNLLLLFYLLDVVDSVFLCGNLAAVFKASASNTTAQQFKDAQLIIPRITKKARLKKVTLNMITDSYCAKDPASPDDEVKSFPLDMSLPRGFNRVDMGPTSIATLTSMIKSAKMVVLVGVTGPVLYEHHMKGTKGIIDQIAAATAEGSIFSVALGMRTGHFLEQLGHAESFTGFSVEPEPFFKIMIRQPLPGIQVLDRMPPNKLMKLSMEQMTLKDQRVLLRLDLDVPSVEGVVLDTDKLEDAAATIQFCLEAGAKCVTLLGHRGEPGGYKNFYLRMEPLVVELSAILGIDVNFIDRPCSKKAKTMLADPPEGSVFLMENLKFYPAESGVDAEPRKKPKSSKQEVASLTEVSELPKDEVAAEDSPATNGPEHSGSGEEDTTNEGGTGEATEGEVKEEEEEEEDSVSGEDVSVSDGEGGQSVDSLMFQLMRPKTVEQFNKDLAACGDVFINDDVAHVEEPLTSYQGFGLQERGCGLLLAEFLRDSEESSVYQLPGVEGLSEAK